MNYNDFPDEVWEMLGVKPPSDFDDFKVWDKYYDESQIKRYTAEELYGIVEARGGTYTDWLRLIVENDIRKNSRKERM